MTLAQLQILLDKKQFHHATYRNLGTVWEGLYIYVNEPQAPRGFTLAGGFNKTDANLSIAEDMVRSTGVSLGAYGKG